MACRKRISDAIQVIDLTASVVAVHHHNNAVWAKSHVTIVIVTCDDCDRYIDHHMR